MANICIVCWSLFGPPIPLFKLVQCIWCFLIVLWMVISAVVHIHIEPYFADCCMASACALFCTKEKITHLRPTKQSHAIPCYSICTCTCCHMPYAPAYPDLSRPGVLRSLKEFSSELMHGEPGPWGPVIQGVWTPDLCLMGDVQIRHFTIAVGMMSHHFSSCLPFLMVSDNFSSLVGGFKHFLFSIYGMSSFPLTNSYFSRWLLHHQPDLVFTLSNLFSIPSDNLTACYWKWPIE